MDKEFECSINSCTILAIWSDGKDQWCQEHAPSPKEREEFDIRPIRRIDVPDYPY